MYNLYNYFSYSSSVVTDCNFTGNVASGNGGGMYNYNSRPRVTNCTFSDNTTDYLGGGMGNFYVSRPTVTNCTFSGNSATQDGGGIINYLNSNPTVTNCILWGDVPDELQNTDSSPNVTYSDVQGGYVGTGNIDEDPCFVDAAAGNLRLRPDSPCIDAGNNTAVPSGISLDPDGNPRGVDNPTSPDTGIGFLGVTVDMGAYEFHPCPITGDINCDGVVDFKDVAILCNNWLKGK
jgi:parallel beta-helix repeat protein